MSDDRKFGTGTRRPLPEEPSWDQVLTKNTVDWHLRNDHDDPDTPEPEVPQRGPVR